MLFNHLALVILVSQITWTSFSVLNDSGSVTSFWHSRFCFPLGLEQTSAGHLVQTPAKAGLTSKLARVAQSLVQSSSQYPEGYNLLANPFVCDTSHGEGLHTHIPVTNGNFLSCNLSVASHPFAVHFKVDHKSLPFRYSAMSHPCFWDYNQLAMCSLYTES